MNEQSDAFTEDARNTAHISKMAAENCSPKIRVRLFDMLVPKSTNCEEIVHDGSHGGLPANGSEHQRPFTVHRLLSLVTIRHH